MGFLDEKRCALCGRSEEYVQLSEHHKIKRSTGGTDEDVVYLCMTINPRLGCSCHAWVEQHPAKAKELGLHIPVYKINGRVYGK
jgi:hypothetical protein